MHPMHALACHPPHTHTHCDLCTNSLNQDGLDGLESSSIGMGFSTTHSLSVPYVSAAATNMPRVSPYVSSSNSTETFSDLVRRLLTSQIGCPRTRRCRGGRTSARASLADLEVVRQLAILGGMLNSDVKFSEPIHLTVN